MSKVENLPVKLSAVKNFMAVQGSNDMQAVSKAARELMAALRESLDALEAGHKWKQLTVCTGQIGYCDPKDVVRLIKGEIPRITVYRKKKTAHNMPMHYKNPPSFYKGLSTCSTQKKSTAKPASGKSSKKSPQIA